MKTLFAIIVISVLGLATSLVIGQDQPQLPPGVSGENWIPIAENFGFAMLPGSAQDQDILTGHFFLRHQDSWKRLDDEGGFRLQPLHK